jgi:hypothetical protein
MGVIARGFVLSLAGVLTLSAPSFAQRASERRTPAPQTSNALATVQVETLDSPEQLASLGVVDASGAPVGKVVSVKTGSDGKAKRVMVALTTAEGAGRVAAIRPETLTFDKTKRVLVAQFTPAQLTQLAATASTTGGLDTSQSSGRVMRRLPSAGDDQAPMAH